MTVEECLHPYITCWLLFVVNVVRTFCCCCFLDCIRRRCRCRRRRRHRRPAAAFYPCWLVNHRSWYYLSAFNTIHRLIFFFYLSYQRCLFVCLLMLFALLLFPCRTCPSVHHTPRTINKG